MICCHWFYHMIDLSNLKRTKLTLSKVCIENKLLNIISEWLALREILML